MTRFFLINCLLVLAMCSSGGHVSGTNDEVVTGVRATIRYPDGTAVDGASVRLFQLDDTLCTYATSTDDSGHYVLQDVPKGVYNVWSEKEMLVACQDSVDLHADDQQLADDTLKAPLGVSATIGLQPDDDPRSVYIRIMGSDLRASVASNGTFSIIGMAAGSYRLGLFPTLPGYIPTFYPLKLGGPMAIRDTLWVDRQ